MSTVTAAGKKMHRTAPDVAFPPSMLSSHGRRAGPNLLTVNHAYRACTQDVREFFQKCAGGPPLPLVAERQCSADLPSALTQQHRALPSRGGAQRSLEPHQCLFVKLRGAARQHQAPRQTLANRLQLLHLFDRHAPGVAELIEPQGTFNLYQGILD